MAYKVEATEDFVEDFSQIIDDLNQNHFIQYAEKITHELESNIERISDTPELFAKVDFEHSLHPSLRKFTIGGKYTAFYEVYKDERKVLLIRLIPSMRDLVNLIQS